jgi:hypothetical protein
MTIAALPEKEREAIRSGASAKNVLARKAQEDRLRKMRERVALDMRTGELSDRLADVIIAFCNTIDGVPESRILEGYFDAFLGSLELALEIADLHPLRLSKRLTLKQRFLRTRPRVEGDPLPLAYRAEWLATLLLSEAPEPQIRELAIEKAGKGRQELKVRKPPVEVWNEKIQHNAQISAGPPRRPVSLGEHGPT